MYRLRLLLFIVIINACVIVVILVVLVILIVAIQQNGHCDLIVVRSSWNTSSSDKINSSSYLSNEVNFFPSYQSINFILVHLVQCKRNRIF